MLNVIPNKVILRSDDHPPPLEPEPELMRFRLFYEGSFLSSNGDPQAGQVDRRAPHKHVLRRAFHKQLGHLWQSNRFLRETTVMGTMFGTDPGPTRPLVEVVRDAHPNVGFNWVPLVCKQFSVDCRLDILLLRRDRPREGLLNSRDIDNRLKTLFDALKMPKDMGELGAVTPQAGEDPFFVLLQSDDLVAHVSLETDELLDPPSSAGQDDSYARLLINVTINPHDNTVFNLGFL